MRTFSAQRAVLPRKSASVGDDEYDVPADWFMAVPNNAAGAEFVRALTAPMEAQCVNNTFLLACADAPEYPLLHDRVSDGLFSITTLDVAIARPPWQPAECQRLDESVQHDCEVLQESIAGEGRADNRGIS